MNKVSVILPCYNGERTIRRCLDSILNQTYQNFEILFVNDGSTDHTLEIVREYAAKEERIKVIDAGRNQGVSAARNLGMQYITGDYVQFIDSDDEMLPEMMEKLLTALEKQDAQIAVCNFSGNPIFYTDFKERTYDFSNENDLMEYYQDTFCMLLVWNKIYRREILTVRFDEEVKFAEDELFNLAVLKNAERVVCIDEPLYIYHYAPAEMNMAEVEEKSCMNKIIEATSQDSKNSIWYRGEDLVPRRKKILEEMLLAGRISNIENYLYTRVFDFYFWELSAFLYMSVGKQTIVQETLQVFQENDFIKSLQVQEKYGLHFIRYEKDELSTVADLFVDLCMESYQDIRRQREWINPYKISILLFMRLFCAAGKKRCRQYNLMYQLKKEIRENETLEAIYYNRFFESSELEELTHMTCVEVS